MSTEVMVGLVELANSEYDECIRHIPQNEDNEVFSIFVLETIVNHVC